MAFQVPRQLQAVSNPLLAIVAAFVIIPYLPGWVLMAVDFFVVRLALLVGIIAAAYVSPVTAIAAFLVVALLFIQRNKVKVKHIRTLMEQSTEDSPAIRDIVSSPTAPAQPSFEAPETDYHDFFPQKDSGDDSFAPVDESQDTKQPLETETTDGSSRAIDQLFGWVDPRPAQAP